MKYFLGYIKKSFDEQRITANDRIFTVSKEDIIILGQLFGMDNTSFEMIFSHYNAQIRLSLNEYKTLIKFTEYFELQEHINFIMLFIKKINYDVNSLEFDLKLKNDFYDEINSDNDSVQTLIKMFESYIKYEKTSGGSMDILQNQISYISENKPYHIKNGFIVHGIISAAFHKMTGINDAYKINNDDWKDRLIESYTSSKTPNKHFEQIRLKHCYNWISALNKYLLDTGYTHTPAKQVVQNKIGRILVSMLSITDYSKIGKVPNYKTAVKWAERDS